MGRRLKEVVQKDVELYNQKGGQALAICDDTSAAPARSVSKPPPPQPSTPPGAAGAASNGDGLPNAAIIRQLRGEVTAYGQQNLDLMQRLEALSLHVKALTERVSQLESGGYPWGVDRPDSAKAGADATSSASAPAAGLSWWK